MKTYEGEVLIECPNTIFHLYVNTEDEVEKIKIFMNNLRNAGSTGIHDIYTWCNRQKVVYETTFNYKKDQSFWNMFCSFISYKNMKRKYQL